jgi:ABC-type branched-subunit amino acid transport system ATPase component
MDPNHILLSTRKLNKAFGGIQAVNELDLDILKGKITGLIGPNGAGKSTVFNLINGIIPPDSGEILFSGHRLEGLKPHQVAELGIARTFQSMNNFARLSVFENVRAGIIAKSERDSTGEVEKILDLLGLSKVKEKRVEEITPVARRLVEVGRALICKPQLVLFDEIMAGFNEQEVAGLIDTIRRANREGITFCIIGHTMRAIMSVSDIIVVMRNGSRFTVGTPDEIQKDREVQKIYFGE